jgi:hypothetical protein
MQAEATRPSIDGAKKPRLSHAAAPPKTPAVSFATGELATGGGQPPVLLATTKTAARTIRTTAPVATAAAPRVEAATPVVEALAVHAEAPVPTAEAAAPAIASPRQPAKRQRRPERQFHSQLPHRGAALSLYRSLRSTRPSGRKSSAPSKATASQSPPAPAKRIRGGISAVRPRRRSAIERMPWSRACATRRRCQRYSSRHRRQHRISRNIRLLDRVLLPPTIAIMVVSEPAEAGPMP